MSELNFMMIVLGNVLKVKCFFNLLGIKINTHFFGEKPNSREVRTFTIKNYVIPLMTLKNNNPASKYKVNQILIGLKSLKAETKWLDYQKYE